MGKGRRCVRLKQPLLGALAAFASSTVSQAGPVAERGSDLFQTVRIAMETKPVSALCILAVCLLAISCKELNPTSTTRSGPLIFEPIKFSDAIPDEYGALSGVTYNPADPAWATLWFQKPDRTISAVFVNVSEGRIHEMSLTIPRK
jgi:hypothetical protein